MKRADGTIVPDDYGAYARMLADRAREQRIVDLEERVAKLEALLHK